MIGKTVSHYTIAEEIGRGGMGVVYRARDDRLERDVALKFLPPNLTADAAARERFIREARAASSLDHQNICTIFDVGESEDGQTYIVMAYYEGETLKSRIDDGPLPIEEAVSIAVQVADGLGAAHRKGIVHRDVKPGNIIVTTGGIAKVLDFGLAKLAGTKVELTAQDSTLGTAAYMSPEQARGEDIDAQTDVWALGVILYEMLAGRRPFAADYEQALLYGILNEEPPDITSLRPDVPEDLALVVHRSLRKVAAERLAGADEFAGALRSGSVPVSSAVGIPLHRSDSAAPSKAKLSRPVIGAAVAAIITMMATGVWLLSRGDSSAAPVDRSVIAVMPFSVQGDPELQYLETGMVDLLSRKLDGAASLRGVDPNALLGRLGEDTGGIRDPERARELATGFGAGQYIIGSVTKIGASVQLNASLYDTEGALQTEAETTSSSDDLMSSIDRLAQQLIADQLAAAGQTLDQTAATTTESLPALKAFLEGERALSEGRPSDAVTSMREATSLDSTFALAWYRLGDALGWAGVVGGPERDSALVRALRYKDRLPRQAQQMIDAEKAFNEARFDDARALYEDVIRRQPENVSALLKLGDLIFHYGDREGFPAVRSREYFERALALNPENQEGQSHLISIAAKQRDSVALASYLKRFDRGPSDNPVIDIADRLVAGEHSDGPFYEEVRQMMSQSPQAPFVAAAMSATVLEDLDEARNWAGLAAESDIPQLREGASGFRSFIDVARGRVAAGLAQADSIQASSPPYFHLMAALTPYASFEEDELAEMRRAFAAADLNLPQSNPLPSNLRTQSEAFRQYLLGLLDFRASNMESLTRQIERLDAIDYDGDAPDLARRYAAVLRGLRHWRNDEPDEALQNLQNGHIPLHWNRGNNPILDESFNRWTIAEIHREQGRPEEALAYYESLVGMSNFLGLLTLGPSYLRRAEIYQELEHHDKAIDYYTRVIDLWKDADPELQPFVQQAREGLEQSLDRKAAEPS